MSEVLVINLVWNGWTSVISNEITEEVKENLSKLETGYDVFENEASGNMDELIDDILSEEYESVLIVAKPVSYHFAEGIKRNLIEEINEVQILIIGDEALELAAGAKERKSGPLYQAMVNGHYAFTTGIYPESVVGAYTKHVGCDNKEYVAQLGEYLNVSSAIIANCDSYESTGYSDAVSGAMEENVYLPHFHQLVKDGEQEKLWIDDTEQYQNLKKCTYAQFYEWEADKTIDKNYLYICSLSRRDDLECFMKDLIRYEETGEIRYPNFALEDECRWYTACNMKYLTRFHITEQGKVKPCSSCSECIGDIEDSYYVNMRNAAKCIDRAFLRRKCKECEVKEVCSRCSMLPDFMEEEEYCTIRREHLLISDFIDKKNMYYYLFQFSQKVRNCENMLFSNPLFSMCFPEDKKETVDLSRKVYLMKMEGHYYLFNMKQGSLFEVDEKLVFLLEGYIKNFTQEEITKMYSVQHKVEMCESETIAEKGMKFLRSAGVIR